MTKFLVVLTRESGFEATSDKKSFHFWEVKVIEFIWFAVLALGLLGMTEVILRVYLGGRDD